MKDRRLTLEKHVGKRLLVEGILIDIHQPNQKNGYKYGLVFASVHLPNEKDQLDHVVIPVNKQFIMIHEPTRFKKYRFTALVESYTKINYLYGIAAHVKAYQLNNINTRRFDEMDTIYSPHLSYYIQNTLRRLDTSNLPININELSIIILNKKEGQREKYLNQLTMTLRKPTVTKAEILDKLYKKQRSGKPTY